MGNFRISLKLIRGDFAMYIAPNLYRLLVLILCMMSSAAYSETVYKCTDAQGNVAYSNEPCPGGEMLQLDVNNGASRSDANDGLRATEKEMLKSLEEQQTKSTVAEKQPQEAQATGCSGIDILSETAKTYAHKTMRGGNNMVLNHCVLMGLSLGIQYYGKIIDEDLQQDIRQRFYGAYADGSTKSARSIKLSAGSASVEPDSQYQVELCFGGGESDLVAVGCR